MNADNPDPNRPDPNRPKPQQGSVPPASSADPSQDHPSGDNPIQDDAASLDALFGEGSPDQGSEELDQLKQQLAEAEKRILIAHADLENYRKRARREREEDLKYAQVPLIADLLPVLDNLQRAIQAVPPDEQSSGIAQGVKLVEKQLVETLARRGVEVIQAEGQPFDPNCHEAILQQPSGEVPPGTVLTQTQTGYRLHDRVIRPSQVIVSSAPAESPSEGQQ